MEAVSKYVWIKVDPRLDSEAWTLNDTSNQYRRRVVGIVCKTSQGYWSWEITTNNKNLDHLIDKSGLELSFAIAKLRIELLLNMSEADPVKTITTDKSLSKEWYIISYDDVNIVKVHGLLKSVNQQISDIDAVAIGRLDHTWSWWPTVYGFNVGKRLSNWEDIIQESEKYFEDHKE